MKNLLKKKLTNNQYFLKYSKKHKLSFLELISTTKNLIQHLNYKFHRTKNFDSFSILALIFLGYALMRSGTFLIFYLIIWNIYPASQYYILYNPISFEIYLLLLSFFIAWYSLRLLFTFPKQFQIHLWIFHRLVLDNLDYFSKRYTGTNYKLLEIFWILLFMVIVCCWPKYGLFLIWILTICMELYCLDNIRKPQILLFIPKWVKFFDESTESSNTALSESDDILPEEDYSMTTISQFWALWEYEEDITEPQNQPIPDFTLEDFEAFFAENTFIPPLVTDLYEDEFKDGWVNWFWLNLCYKLLPVACIINIIICILFFFWGIPEFLYFDMQICDVIVQDFLAEYQRMLLIYTNTQWSSSWKWLVGGIGFRSYFKKYGFSFFNISNDIEADSLLSEYKKYIKYTYYLNHQISRKGRIFSQIFPLYYEYLQIKYFFNKMRDFTTPLRETFLHKYFFYDDLYIYQQLKEMIPISRSKRGILNRKKKQEIFSWLYYKSKTWSKDYYYTSPAVHIFPEKHYSWLDLLRILFVLEELDFSFHDTWVNMDKWFDTDPFEYNEEFGQHFLEEYFYDFGDVELTFDFEANELDNELYTMLKHQSLVTNLLNYFVDTHPIVESSIYGALPPSFYADYISGKISVEPDYITQEAFDYESMKFGKFTYIGPSPEMSEDPKLDSFEILDKKYSTWVDKSLLNMYTEYKEEYDWNLEFEDEEIDFFKTNTWQTNDYEILSSYYHQANLDILPDLLQDMDPVQLQNKTFFSYVNRNDTMQYPNRRRSFLYEQMLQTFTYAASTDLASRYNNADFFELIETTPNIQLGQSYDFVMFYLYGKYTHGLSDYYQKYIKGFDSRGTRTELFKNLNETNWYKYYYKVDTIMNYYDYMPSYRKFFMKTWPIEYTDTPYNFFGKIDTVKFSNNFIFTGDDWIIYVPTTNHSLFWSEYTVPIDFNNIWFDPLLFI